MKRGTPHELRGNAWIGAKSVHPRPVVTDKRSASARIAALPEVRAASILCHRTMGPGNFSSSFSQGFWPAGLYACRVLLYRHRVHLFRILHATSSLPATVHRSRVAVRNQREGQIASE